MLEATTKIEARGLGITKPTIANSNIQHYREKMRIESSSIFNITHALSLVAKYNKCRKNTVTALLSRAGRRNTYYCLLKATQFRRLHNTSQAASSSWKKCIFYYGEHDQDCILDHSPSFLSVHLAAYGCSLAMRENLHILLFPKIIGGFIPIRGSKLCVTM